VKITKQKLKEIVKEELEKATANEGILGDKPSGRVHPSWRDATEEDALVILQEALWDLSDGYTQLGYLDISRKLMEIADTALAAAEAGKTTRG
jgi:hypothetical protein